MTYFLVADLQDQTLTFLICADLGGCQALPCRGSRCQSIVRQRAFAELLSLRLYGNASLNDQSV